MQFYNNISTEKIDIIQKIAFVYWYEQMEKSGYTMKPNHTELYQNVKHEVLDYGYDYTNRHSE